MSYLANLTLVVHDYDEAIDFYTRVLDFELVEDTRRSPEKRWVRVRPPGANDRGCCLLLAKAKGDEQRAAIGRQTGGRVAFFWHVPDFDAVHARLIENEVKIIRGPVTEEYGKVAVFEDLYGNLWDLIQPI